MPLSYYHVFSTNEAELAPYRKLHGSLMTLQCEGVINRMEVFAANREPEVMALFTKNKISDLYYKRVQYLYDYFEVLEDHFTPGNRNYLKFPDPFSATVFLRNTADIIMRTTKTKGVTYDTLMVDAEYVDQRTRYLVSLTDRYHRPFVETLYDLEAKPHLHDIVYPIPYSQLAGLE